MPPYCSRATTGTEHEPRGERDEQRDAEGDSVAHTQAARAHLARSPRALAPHTLTRSSSQPRAAPARARAHAREERGAEQEAWRRRARTPSPRPARARARSPAPARRTRPMLLDSRRSGRWPAGSPPRAPSAAGGRWRPGGRTPRRCRTAPRSRQLPDLHVAGEDQRGEQRVQREAHEVGHDHHPVARQPVGPHAADQQEARPAARRAQRAPGRGRSRCRSVRSRTARARRSRCSRRSRSPTGRTTGSGNRGAGEQPVDASRRPS